MEVIEKNGVLDRLYSYCRLMRLNTSIVVLRYICPALIALWLAGKGRPDLKIVIIFILGAVIMRSAGCVINDYLDRDIDCKVQRTKTRPLVADKISAKEALILFMVLCLCAFILVLLLNGLTVVLSILGLCMTILYPTTKRFFFSPELVVGLAICWGVVLAFAAQIGSVPVQAWIVFAAMVLLTISDATIYAIADREEDQMLGLNSTAIFLKHYDRPVIGLLQFSGICLLVYIGYREELNILYFLSIGAAALALIYSQYLIREHKPENCIRAWKNYSWFWLLVFFGVLVGYQY